MSFVKKLLTGAGNVTKLDFPDKTPQFILVEAVDVDLPLTGYKVSVGGESTIAIASSQTHLQALSKFLMEPLLGANIRIGQIIVLADGAIKGKGCEVDLTNAGATTPDLHAFSMGSGGVPAVVETKTIQDGNDADFSDFDVLIFDPANLENIQINFFGINGQKDWSEPNLTQVEIDCMFAMEHPADVNGQLAGLSIIDNSDEKIDSVNISAIGGTIKVLTASL